MANKTVRDKIIDALSPLGLNPKLQGSYETAAHLPNSFATYYIPDTQILETYDNKPYKIGYTININYYSSNMSDINTVPDKIFDTMIAAGFTAEDVGYDGGLDKETNHYSWLMEFNYVQERSL